MILAITSEQLAGIQRAVSAGLKSLERPEPLKLADWAEENFYLSAESSYDEGRWECFGYQRQIMNVISNEDVRGVTVIKSTRLGYTKIILASILFHAEHKKRNQAVWHPVDADAAGFVKRELDPAIRDCQPVIDIFPDYGKKAKGNTLDQKTFIGSLLHIRGGKAAKNYRAISVDVAYLDELAGFDGDIEMEGDPVTLASQRIIASTFPKLVTGSTPKTLGSCLITKQADEAEEIFRYHIPCPHCEAENPLVWGGKDADHGFKWIDDDPKTVGHLCKSCGSLFKQQDILESHGRFVSKNGVAINDDGDFSDLHGNSVLPPLSVAFHVWTAYNPMVSWVEIVRQFIAAKKDPIRLKTFVNTTLGEAWEEDESEKMDGFSLMVRRENYPAEVPDGVKIITAGIDTQDDRFEIQIDGWGAGEERWSIAYHRLYGDPSRAGLWDKLAELLRSSYKKQDGTTLHLAMACQDHGGHFSDEVNRFSRKMGVRFLVPIKGSSGYGDPVAKFPRKRNAKSVYLTMIGTDTAKELLYHRMQINDHGAGYWHFPVSEQFDDEYFRQLTNEERVPRWVKGKKRFVWDAKSRRNEPFDCSVYSLAAIRILQQHMGANLESKPAEKKPDAKQKKSRKGGFVKNWK